MVGDSLAPSLPVLDRCLDFSSSLLSLDMCLGFRNLSEEDGMLMEFWQESG